VLVQCSPAAPLSGLVTGYYGFSEATAGPTRRREGPGGDVVVIISFGEDWLIDGERLTSFAAGLHVRQVTTEHGGRSFGMQISLTPPAAHKLFGLPMHLLAHRQVPLGEVLADASLVDRLHDAGGWPERFKLLDVMLMKRFTEAPPPPDGVCWAWRRLVETDGRIPVGELAKELGWSRKRIVARFREQVGLPPKALGRVLRFERARALAERTQHPDWTRIAIECGYCDQSHLINEFRAITGRTPATFLQDAVASPA